MEILKAQLTKKDSKLQKWWKEWDQLVAALEIHLKVLISSNIQKNNVTVKLKKITSETSDTEEQTVDRHLSSIDPVRVKTEPQTCFEVLWMK